MWGGFLPGVFILGALDLQLASDSFSTSDLKKTLMSSVSALAADTEFNLLDDTSASGMDVIWYEPHTPHGLRRCDANSARTD